MSINVTNYKQKNVFAFVEEDDITSCSKCRQLVTDPTTLPCLDSLCGKCFKEVCSSYANNSSSVGACPRCGDQFYLPTSHLQTLPDRGFIDTLVAVKKIANQNPSDNRCYICRQLSESAPVTPVSYCTECRQKMCSSCLRPHQMFPATKNHETVDLGVESADRVLRMIKSYSPVCTNHRDTAAAVHCYQCSVSLCSVCQDMHSSHEIEVLTDDTYSQLSISVKSVSDQLHQQSDACEMEKGRIQQLLSDRRNGLQDAQKEINDKAEEMISLIQKQRDDLLTALHSRNDQTISNLETVSETLSTVVVAQKKAQTFTKELLDKGSVEDLLLNYRMLNDRVASLRNKSSGIFVTPDDMTSSDVSSESMIHDVCTSLDAQSKHVSTL